MFIVLNERVDALSPLIRFSRTKKNVWGIKTPLAAQQSEVDSRQRAKTFEGVYEA